MVAHIINAPVQNLLLERDGAVQGIKDSNHILLVLERGVLELLLGQDFRVREVIRPILPLDGRHVVSQHRLVGEHGAEPP